MNETSAYHIYTFIQLLQKLMNCSSIDQNKHNYQTADKSKRTLMLMK
jgi:hypothetical protein